MPQRNRNRSRRARAPTALGLHLPATFRRSLFPPNPCRGMVYTFCETTAVADLVQSNAGDVLLGYDFRLANLTNTASYSAIFDSYRIDKIEMEFLPQFNAIPPSGTAIGPVLYVAVDYDDAVAAGSSIVMDQYSNLQVFSATEPAYVSFKPAIATGVWDGSSSTLVPAGTSQAPWLDIGSTSIVHYAVKVCVTANAAAATGNQRWRVRARYTISCANQR
jgi:hypothetical protein